MKTRSHNKKRNSGIIFELLLRHVSSRLIEEDTAGAQKALNIIEKYFKKGSELYKEFRLFNALAKSHVSNTSIAAAILTEAKQAARRCDIAVIDKEKSNLIREINHTLEDPKFYYRRVPEYTVYATIQTLLNEWRNLDSSDLRRLVDYETKIVEWLLTEKEAVLIENEANPDVNALVVKIMTEKFNKKYAATLSAEQKELVRSYVFSLSNDGGISIAQKLNEIKDSTLDKLEIFVKETNNEIILGKATRIKKLIEEQSLSEGIDDSSIAHFLIISQLKNELMEIK